MGSRRSYTAEILPEYQDTGGENGKFDLGLDGAVVDPLFWVCLRSSHSAARAASGFGEGRVGRGEGAGDNHVKASYIPFLEAHRRDFDIGHKGGESVSFYSVS